MHYQRCNTAMHLLPVASLTVNHYRRNPRHHYTDVQPLPDDEGNDWESPEIADKLHPPPVAGEHVSGYEEISYRPPPAIPTDQIPGATHHGGRSCTCLSEGQSQHRYQRAQTDHSYTSFLDERYVSYHRL